MLLSLSDEVIDETCGRFHVVPDGCSELSSASFVRQSLTPAWLFEFLGGGCLAEVSDSCFPQSHRESAFTVAALHQWGHTEPPLLDTRCMTTAEEWIIEVIHPRSPGGPIPCVCVSSPLPTIFLLLSCPSVPLKGSLAYCSSSKKPPKTPSQRHSARIGLASKL